MRLFLYHYFPFSHIPIITLLPAIHVIPLSFYSVLVVDVVVVDFLFIVWLGRMMMAILVVIIVIGVFPLEKIIHGRI